MNNNLEFRRNNASKDMLTGKSSIFKYWLASLAINAVILVSVLFFSELMYETNDDYSISWKIIEGYPYVGFVNYYLCRALIPIQQLFGSVNVFIVSQIAASFVAFTMVYRILLERSKTVAEDIISALIIVLFSLDHYCCIQFTKTSALLMAAGLVYIADTYIGSRSLLSFAGGFLLYFTGVCYRQMGMFPALLYGGAFIILWLIFNREDFIKDKQPLHEFFVLLVIASLLVVPYGFDKLSDRMNASTPELAFAREYQAERVKITDYPVLDNYDMFSEEYNEAGISKNDVRMIDRFALDYDGGASLDRLKTINTINSPTVSKSAALREATMKFLRKTWKSLKTKSFTGMHIIVFALMCVLGLIVLRPRSWLYILAIGLFTIVIYIIIYYRGRANYRAFYVADISTALWLLYIFTLDSQSADEEKQWRGWAEMITCALVVLVVITFTMKGVGILKNEHEEDARVVETEQISEYLSNHPDVLYIMPTPIQKYPARYLSPLEPAVMQNNCTNTGGWETLTPSRMHFLEEQDIRNPIKDAIDNPRVLVFGKYKQDMFLEYYNKWYGNDMKKVEFEKVDEVGETEIFKIITVDS